ncbi:MAG: fibrobacter succinogenes major paralogous domain-containing protein [Bacteroidales bacterium]|nr:fibrobacter succinogenes major paralogous domain-containing protein [Bacteroidales bacterium]
MTTQDLRNKTAKLTTQQLRESIAKYEWALSKTSDTKERAVMVSVIARFKNILAERLLITNDDTYKSIKIWKQVWTAENLNIGHFRNGDVIPEAKSSVEWKSACENGKPAWCFYDNDPANEYIYGKLYNWYAVTDQRNLTPVGWHIPSYAEWDRLINDEGYENRIGGDLKETGTTHWRDPNIYASDIHGFKALPGGHREDPYHFFNLGKIGKWWTATECHPYKAWSFAIYNIYGAFLPKEEMKSSGYSVRCVRD